MPLPKALHDLAKVKFSDVESVRIAEKGPPPVWNVSLQLKNGRRIGLGVSDDKIVFSSQQFSFGGNQYQRSKFRVLDRVAAYAGLPLTYADIVPVPNPPGGDINDVFVTKPARGAHVVEG